MKSVVDLVFLFFVYSLFLQEGSSECTMCGNGTKANKNKDGCDYNGCKFTPAPGVMYDLSPLRRDGGSMYLVRTNRSRYYFPLYYYINICSLKHDNTSCYTQTRNVVTTGVVDKYPNKTPYKVVRNRFVFYYHACYK